MNKNKEQLKDRQYLITWYNGYYDVTRPVAASSPKEAISLAKEIFNTDNDRGFKMRDNPPINCGLYGEPRVEMILTK